MENSEKPPSRPRNLEDVGRRADKEIEDFIRWFNDDVVPSLRHRSSQALRIAADKLTELASYMERQKEREKEAEKEKDSK